MIENLEKQKMKAKEAINQALDEYYSAFENASNKAGFNINTRAARRRPGTRLA